MFRSDFAEKQFLEIFARLTVAVEKLVPVPVKTSDATNLQRVRTFYDVKRLYRSGDKIGAIKLFREMTGAGLKDSKDMVEAIKFDIFS